MKSIVIAVVLLFSGVIGVSDAKADSRYHGHARTSIGVTFGPYWGPWYYPPPYYYYPPMVIERAPPPIYIEQPSVQSAPPEAQTSYWYYCRTKNAYYPYVKECPAGWQKVLPQPADQR